MYFTEMRLILIKIFLFVYLDFKSVHPVLAFILVNLHLLRRDAYEGVNLKTVLGTKEQLHNILCVTENIFGVKIKTN